MNNIDAKKLEAVLKDKQFAQHLLTLEAPEDVKKAFGGKGIHFTLEEVKEIGAALSEQASSLKDGELSQENLEAVSGGFVITGITAIGIAKLLIGVAGLGLATYEAYKARW